MIAWLHRLFCRLWRDHANVSECYVVGNRELARCLDCGAEFDLGKHFANLPSDQ